MDLSPQDVRPAFVLVSASVCVEAAAKPPQTFWQRLTRRKPRVPRLPIILPNALSGALESGAPFSDEAGNYYDEGDVSDLRDLMVELGASAVPRLRVGKAPLDECFIIGAGEALGGCFTNLRVIWSKKRRVYVYYAAGLGESFLEWAASFQPDLYDALWEVRNDVVTAVPLFRKMDAVSFSLFTGLKQSIWPQG